MKTQYITHKQQWSAFMTLNGLDIQEYGDTEQSALENLTNKIANSDFLLEGLKTEYSPKVGDSVYVYRKIGKHGEPQLVKGVVVSFSKSIIVDGQKTVLIKYDDGKGEYWHPINKVIFKK